MTAPARTLILPGWQNSGSAHWQSRWEALHGFARVEQNDWDRPLRGDWMARLEETVRDGPFPVALVAHSLGCQLVAAWAAHSSSTGRVACAMLVAPPDTARADMPPALSTWRQITTARLPFKTLVVFSDDDPYCAADRAGAMAADWGAATLLLSGKGHLNAESGLDDWPEGVALLQGMQA